MKLVFSANAFANAEKTAGKSLADIITELNSDAGASLTTIRALLAAAVTEAEYPKFPWAIPDVYAAGKLIDEHGIETVAMEIGKALRSYFDKQRGAVNGN